MVSAADVAAVAEEASGKAVIAEKPIRDVIIDTISDVVIFDVIFSISDAAAADECDATLRPEQTLSSLPVIIEVVVVAVVVVA